MLDEADRIWNRACDPFPHHSTPGDRALQAARSQNGAIIDALGGGVHERLEQLEDEYCAAVPRDAVLEAAFRKRLSEAHEDFVPA